MADAPAPAAMTPADHALAHALSIYAGTVQPQLGATDSLGMAIRCALRGGCGDNPIARQLHLLAAELVRSAPGTGERARADHSLRRILSEFHWWRLRLALDRIEQGEKANG